MHLVKVRLFPRGGLGMMGHHALSLSYEVGLILGKVEVSRLAQETVVLGVGEVGEKTGSRPASWGYRGLALSYEVGLILGKVEVSRLALETVVLGVGEVGEKTGSRPASWGSRGLALGYSLNWI